MYRLCRNLIFVAILFQPYLTAADDPFVGTWRYRQDKEQAHSTYKILAVGEKKFQVDNGVGLGPVLPSDGSLHQSPLGGTVSLKQLDDHSFLYVLKRKTTYKRIITLNGDTMKWNEDQELDTGKHTAWQSNWRRIGKGQGLAGEWVMTSRQDPTDVGSLIVRKTSGGLSIQNSQESFVDQVYFDGKDHASKDPDEIQGVTTLTDRPDSRTMRSVQKRNGKVLGTITYTVSADGKVLTATADMPKSGTSVMVWERVD